MESFNFAPGIFKLTGAVFAVLSGIGLAFIVSYISVGLNYPLWLEIGLYAFALLIFYEGMAMILKPIALSYEDGKFKARYLISQYNFTLEDIESYSTISYPTRYGIKNGLIFHLKGNRVMEINEVIMDGNVSLIRTMLEQHQIRRHREDNRTLWLSRFPGHYRSGKL